MAMVTCLAFLTSTLAGVNAVSLRDCQRGRIDVVNGTEASVTCEFTDTNDTISWFIGNGGHVSNIGNCSQCVNLSCPCDAVTGYDVSRTEADGGDGNSTVTFFALVDDYVDTTITCSKGTAEETCGLRVVGGYRLSDCFVVEGNTDGIDCNDIDPDYGVNWTISYDEGASFNDVAHCGPCGDVTCPPCDVRDTDFNVTRAPESSILQLLDEGDAGKGDARVRCTRSDRADISGTCQIKLYYYRIPQCVDGQIEISEVEPPPLIQCEGLRRDQRMNWTLTDSLGHTSQIAFCGRRNCTAENGSDVMVARDNQVSNLTFGDHVRWKGNMTLTCIRRNGCAHDSCRIRTIFGPDEVTLNGSVLYIPNDLDTVTLTCAWSEAFPDVSVLWSVPCVTVSPDNSTCRVDASLAADVSRVTCTAVNTKFPQLNASAAYTFYRAESDDDDYDVKKQVSVAAVAGGVVAAVVVTAVVVIIVIVVVKRRRGNMQGPAQNSTPRETQSAAGDSSNDDYLVPVAPSTYQHQQGHRPTDYQDLRMSEVGLRSEYSDVGSRGKALKETSAETPYSSLRRSDVGLASKYSHFGNRPETS